MHFRMWSAICFILDQSKVLPAWLNKFDAYDTTILSDSIIDELFQLQLKQYTFGPDKPP